MTITIGRVYDDLPAGVHRILVDRLWPRGLRKEDPRIGEWCKEVAPSTELREWYHHNEGNVDVHEVFVARYREELASGEQADALAHVASEAAKGDVELATATKDPSTSHVPTILEELTGAGG